MTTQADEAMRHALVDHTLIRGRGGITARCVCGWASGGHFTSLAASAAFADHQERASLAQKEKDNG